MRERDEIGAARRGRSSWPAGLAAALAMACGLTIPSAPGLADQPAGAARTVADIRAFTETLWPEAEGRGVARALFDATFANLAPDPAVAALTRRQPEFAKPIGAYLATQVTPARVLTGRAMAARWAADLAGIERRYGVPGSLVVAVWGLETNYGASTGDKDVVRSMATLGALGVRPDLYRDELLTVLDLLRTGRVRRADLRGSWAGAMGLPQFMPSSFARYAVDWTGGGRPDIWTSVPDALASIANFLKEQGWDAGRPWGFEVRVPHPVADGRSRATAAEWATLGIGRADGAPMTGPGEWILFYPAGAAGPAFLVSGNFEVIKTYNMSDAYVLSVASLADRMGGGGAFRAAWPSEVPMGRERRVALQARMSALGYAVDDRQGRVSLAFRDAVRLAQARVGLVADGNPTDALLDALLALPDAR